MALSLPLNHSQLICNNRHACKVAVAVRYMDVPLHVHINRDQNLFYETLTVIIAKLFGELYRVLSLSCCTSTACRSFTYFNMQISIERKCEDALFVLHDSKGTNICVKTIQWGKLRCDFPVVTLRHYGERAFSFKKVNLPELL